MSYSWPTLDSDYDTALHAIGRITALWNSIENIFDELIAFSTGTGFASFQFLSSKLNNSQKIDLVKHNFKRAPHRYATNLVEHILVFFKHAQICSGNRNFYVHAYIVHEDSFLMISKQSQSDVGAINLITPKPNDLRKIANEMDETLDYGAELLKLLKQSLRDHCCPLEMPIKPAQPESWDKHPSRHIHRNT